MYRDLHLFLNEKIDRQIPLIHTAMYDEINILSDVFSREPLKIAGDVVDILNLQMILIN